MLFSRIIEYADIGDLNITMAFLDINQGDRIVMIFDGVPWGGAIMCKLLVSLILAFVVFSGSADSATLLLVPSWQTIKVSETATVDLLISGLGDFTSPSLGAFDIDINFNNSALTFRSETFGTFLGTSIQSVDTSIPGAVNLAEVSLESVPKLDCLQPDSFLLAKLTFEGIRVSTSLVGFGTADLSDALGNVIANPTLVPGNVQVVPIPTAVWLLGAGLIGLLGLRRRFKN